MPMNIPQWAATWAFNRKVQNGNPAVSVADIITGLRQLGIVNGEVNISLIKKVNKGLVQARKKYERFTFLVKDVMLTFDLSKEESEKLVYDEVIRTRQDLKRMMVFYDVLEKDGRIIVPLKRNIKGHSDDSMRNEDLGYSEKSKRTTTKVADDRTYKLQGDKKYHG
jgi:hypothetical protein